MKKTVAILFGGCSSEYKISLQSAYCIIKAIDTEKYAPPLNRNNQCWNMVSLQQRFRKNKRKHMDERKKLFTSYDII